MTKLCKLGEAKHTQQNHDADGFTSFNAKKQELENYELIGDGEGIHWPDLDEDISIEGILAGRRSGESQSSLEKWLKKRTQK